MLQLKKIVKDYQTGDEVVKALKGISINFRKNEFVSVLGQSGCGKTTLTQAIRGQKIHYEKTQYINYHDIVIDTPGEYAENQHLGRALALYSYEADVVGLLLSATEQYSLYSPNITCMANREVIGIVTQIDKDDANPQRSASWLKLAGCKSIFFVDSKSGKGLKELLEWLKE